MKKIFTLIACVIVFAFIGVVIAQEQQSAQKKESTETFGQKEFEAFHSILRPLQHKALPAGNFKLIREKSSALIEKGEAIVKLGPPQGIEKLKEYEKALENFSSALSALAKDSKSAKDPELKKSFSKVHDLYEKLMNMLPD